MNVFRMARESGLAVLLDGRIGRQEYTSVSGSMDALQRFAEAVRTAALRECRAGARPPRDAPADRATDVRQRTMEL